MNHALFESTKMITCIIVSTETTQGRDVYVDVDRDVDRDRDRNRWGEGEREMMMMMMKT